MNDKTMPQNTCATCTHWNREGTTELHQGNCRRYPPQCSLIPSQGGLVNASAYPSCDSKMSCGEFAPKLQS